jgi:hypothetical protein
VAYCGIDITSMRYASREPRSAKCVSQQLFGDIIDVANALAVEGNPVHLDELAAITPTSPLHHPYITPTSPEPSAVSASSEKSSGCSEPVVRGSEAATWRAISNFLWQCHRRERGSYALPWSRRRT